VDEIPVMIGDPEMLKVINEAQAEVAELLARRKPQQNAREKPVSGRIVEMPSPTWQRPAPYWDDAFLQASMWDGWLECDPEEIYFYDLAYTEVAAQAISGALGPNEDPYEFVCRRDPDTLVSTEACATCPFMAGCFGLNFQELEAEVYLMLEGDYDPS
jgi:hypothetical protein